MIMLEFCLQFKQTNFWFIVFWIHAEEDYSHTVQNVSFCTFSNITDNMKEAKSPILNKAVWHRQSGIIVLRTLLRTRLLFANLFRVPSPI